MERREENGTVRMEQVEKRCRACLRIPKAGVKLSTAPQNLPRLSVMLIEVLKVRVPPDRPFPQILCNSCATNLCAVYTFMQTCLESHEKLNRLFDRTACRLIPPTEREHSPDIVDVFEYKPFEPPPLVFDKTFVESFPSSLTCTSCGVNFDNRTLYCEHAERCLNKQSHIEIEVPIKHESENDRFDDFDHYMDSSDDLSLNEETQDPSFPCTSCGETYPSLIRLEVHSVVHDEKNKYKCPVCDKIFATKGYKKHHILLKHAMKGNVQCDICKKLFLRKSDLASHMGKHDKSKAESKKNLKYFCPTCNRGFVRERSMKEHLNVHNGEKALECDICKKVFHVKWQLNAHIKGHIGPMRFLCTLCGQEFKRKEAFRIHMRRHAGENPYKCRFCSKGFVRSSDVKAHEKYHTGERSYICSVCSMAFTRNYSLKVHMRVHTGEKPYICKYCGKRFTQAYDMKLHVRRHTGDGVCCDLCDEKFIQIYMLRQHKRTVHGIELSNRYNKLEKFTDKGKDSGEEESDLQNEC